MRHRYKMTGCSVFHAFGRCRTYLFSVLSPNMGSHGCSHDMGVLKVAAAEFLGKYMHTVACEEPVR